MRRIDPGRNSKKAAIKKGIKSPAFLSGRGAADAADIFTIIAMKQFSGRFIKQAQARLAEIKSLVAIDRKTVLESMIGGLSLFMCRRLEYAEIAAGQTTQTRKRECGAPPAALTDALGE